jgi:hypothetical protein
VKVLEEDKNYKIAADAERLVAHIEENLEYDEEGRSFVRNSKMSEFLSKFKELITKIFSSKNP